MGKKEIHPYTVIVNKKQKIKAKIARNDALAWLAKQFPEAFDNRTRIRPLKHGIMDDILVEAEKIKSLPISKNKLRQAVVIYTRRIDYLACLKAREMRIDLKGHPTTQVTEEEALLASNKIKRNIEMMTKKNRIAEEPTIPPIEYPQNNRTISAMTSYSMEKGYDSAKHSTVSERASPVIKHKIQRAYDPAIVARLKEKLGLSLKDAMNKPVGENS